MLPAHIVIESNPAKALAEFLAHTSYTSVCVLMDENTKLHCYPAIKATLPVHATICVASGEEHKDIATCSLIWQQLTDAKMDRHGLLVILGGGVLGDMGGFCAATYKRGINFVLMPTTLLSQVDASVGGKLGIDFQQFKNHIGLFQEPSATLICTDFLATLPERELRSGFAEVIKHCLISDKAMWEVIASKSLLQQDWPALVKHSVEFKWSVVNQDPKEKGLRKILNYGHTVGHGLEGQSLAEGNRIFHGEAIAVGMICEAFLGMKRQLIGKADLDRIANFILTIFGKAELSKNTKLIIERMIQDKKNKGNKILMALPKGIGQAVWNIEVEEEDIEESMSYYLAACKALPNDLRAN